MGWSAWALDHLWFIVGGLLIVSLLLHFGVMWLFKKSDKKRAESENKNSHYIKSDE